MQSRDATVTVYNFEFLDQGPERARLAPFKAQRAEIASRYKGRILEGTAQVVPERELDDERHLRRIATGWGVL